MCRMRGSAVWVTLLALGLPGLLLAPAWRLGGLGAGEDDVLYYYPSRVLFQQQLADGHAPWLNTFVGLDRPLLADPQAAIFYPTTWLFAILPAPIAYAVSLWLHYALAFFGAYRLARGQRCDRPAAIFAAIAFAFCGFLLAHRAHFTMQHSAAWTPLLLWRIERLLRQPGGLRLAAAALAAALQVLAGHVQIAAITGLGALVWCVALDGGVRLRTLALLAATWIAAAGLAAVQVVPTAFYLAECTRGQRTYADFVENSFNPASIVGLIYPMLLGQRTPNFFDMHYFGPSHQVEQFCYPGLATLLLAGISIAAGPRTPQRRAWIALLVFALLLALGLYGPIAPLLYWLPGANLFRVPARAMLLANLAAALLAALSMQQLRGELTPALSRWLAAAQRWTVGRKPLLAALGIPLLLLLLATPFYPEALAALSPLRPAVWLPIAIGVATWATLRFITTRWESGNVRLLLLPLLALDLGIIGWTLDVPAAATSPRDILPSPERTPWAARIAESRERLWTVAERENGMPGEYVEPLDRLTGNMGSLLGVSVVTDYGPLQPRASFEFFRFKPWGESEPPQRESLLADANWRRRCNVGWVQKIGDEIAVPADAEEVETLREGRRLYRVLDTLGRAYFEQPSTPGTLRHVEISPHEMRTTVDLWPPPRSKSKDAPPRVVVSRLWLPGWRVTTSDGRELPTSKAFDLLLAAELPDGESRELHWEYRPPGLPEGAGASVFMLLTLALLSGCWRPRQMVLQQQKPDQH
jgi:hypothetical protein